MADGTGNMIQDLFAAVGAHTVGLDANQAPALTAMVARRYLLQIRRCRKCLLTKESTSGTA